MDVPSILDALLKRMGSQEKLAHELGVSQATISRWLDESVYPGGRKVEAIRRLAREYGIVPPEGIQRTDMIPVMGWVGAGGEINVEHEQPPPHGFDQVEIDDLTTTRRMVAFEVSGDSMYPEYEPGEIIVVFATQRRDVDEYLNKRVVVRTADGRRFLKRLARGAQRGTYNLESWNARTIEGVQIAWVGEIYATFTPDHVRRRTRAVCGSG